MANGTITGSTNNQYIDSKIEWSSAPNQSKNTSVVTATLYYRRNNTGYTTAGTGNFTVTINGSSTSTNSKSLSIGSSWVAAASGSATVTHNSDGTKTISISATGSLPPSSLTSTNCSGTVKLDTIPRASTFKLSKSDITAGTSVTVTVNKASSSFTHKLLYSYNKTSWTTVDFGSSTSKSVTVPTSYCSHYPNVMSGTLWWRLDTYSETTLIGSSALKSTTFGVPDYTPTVDVTVEKVNTGITFSSNENYVIKGKTRFKVTFSNAKTSYGASIKSYVANGVSSSTNVVTTDYATGTIVNGVGATSVESYIVDSRGQKSKVDTYVTGLFDYFNPTLLSSKVYRCTSAGVEEEEGTYIHVYADYIGASVDNKNTISCIVNYRQAGTSSWQNGGSMLGSKELTFGGGKILPESEYEIQFIVSDFCGGRTEVINILPTVTRILNVLPDSSGVAFGRKASLSKALDARDWKGLFSGLELGGKAVADYVIETGKSGDWNYRKWASGIAECWCEYHATLSTFQSSDKMYYQSFRVNFPFAFSSRPVVSGSTGYTFLNFVTLMPSTTYCTVLYFQYNNSSTANTRNIWLHAIGKI